MEQPRLFKEPRIPAELWLRIFAIATRLPGDLIDPAPPYHIDASPHQWSRDPLDIAENAKLKLNLVLVCRSWKQMATEALYEIIRLSQRANRRQSTRAQKTLRRTLEKNTARGYGQWVKQLVIYMDFVAMEDVAAIIRHCPNLRTLIITKKNPWMQSKIESIFLNAIPKGLRRIELFRTWCVIRPVIPQEFSAILYRCSSIKAASLSCEEVDFGDVLPPSQLAALALWRPRIRHLISLKRWELPFLTHLTLTETDVSELFSAIQHFGPQLLFLDIKPDVTGSTNIFFLQFCSSISEACPCLQGFVLHNEDILPHNLHSHSLTHLVIPFYTTWDPVHRQIRNILVSEFPALKCIRILAGRLLLHNWLIPESSLDWAVGVRARGIKVEDEDGMDLLDPHYPARHFSNERRLRYANMINKGEEQANEWEWDTAIAFSRPGPAKKI